VSWTTVKILAAVLYGALILLALGSSLVPLKAPRPLVSRHDWTADGFIAGPHGDSFEVRREIRRHPETVYWASDWGKPGEKRLESGLFELPPALVLPYRLAYLGALKPAADASVFFECQESGKRLELDLAPTNVSFSERFIEVPDHFCRASARLVAISRDREFIGLSTPYEVDSGESWVHALPSQVLRHFVTMLVLITLGFGGSVAARAVGTSIAAPIPFAITLGLVGHLSFFVFYFDTSAGRVLSFSSIGLVLVLLAAFRVRRRRLLADVWAELSEPVWIWVLVSLFFVLLLYVADTGAGSWQANARFWPAIWSSDNNIAMQVAETVYRERSIESLLGNWTVSDRPQIQTGIQLILRPFSSLYFLTSAHGQHLHYFHHTIGVVMNTFWVLALIHLLREMQLSVRARAATIFAVVFTPFAIFNSVYVWPKMLSGTFGVLALVPVAAPILRARPRDEIYRALPYTAALAALSLLSHGGGVVFLIGLVIWLFWRAGLPRPSVIVVSALVGLAILLPWQMWQRLIDPPGNALLKSAFAGTYGFGEPDIGVLDTIRREFAAITPLYWLQLKWDSLLVLFYGHWESPFDTNWTSSRRWHDFFFLFPSTWAYSLAALSVLIRSSPVRRWETAAETYSWCRSLAAIALIGIGVNWLLFWGPPIVHQQAYACVLVLLVAGIVGGGLSLGSLSYPLYAITLAYTTWVWLLLPLGNGRRLDMLSLGMLGIIVTVAVLYIRPLLLRVAERRTTPSS
jgi:hypothetical protein